MLFRLAGFLAFALLVLAGGIRYVTQASVEEAIRRESVDKALHYAQYMASHIRDIEGLVAGERPAQDQIETVRHIRRLGDIFRFKLFDHHGRLVLVSDDSDLQMRSHLVGAPETVPIHVMAARVPVVNVKDGREDPDRPDLFAEAYVPLISDFGDVFGVAEVYVDQTETSGYFRDSFSRFALMLSGVCALLFSAPYVAYGFQKQRAERSRKDAEFLASYDALTGLMNRREFLDRARELHTAGKLTAICYLDADKFKGINDIHGHAVGDAYLVHLAGVLRSCTHHDDLLARFGGDEFVIGFRDLDLEGVTGRVKSIIRTASQEFHEGDAVIAGSMSAGIAVVAPGDQLDDPLAHADAALYHSKSSGRNMFSVYGDHMGEDYRRRMALHSHLRQTTRDKNFSLLYQRLVDASTQKVVGYEALLRMVDEDGSEIPPSVFIPVAEELGLISEIGAWVLQTATQEIAGLDDHSLVSVNLSAAQLHGGDLPEIVASALKEAGLPPDRLELEITESLLLDDDASVAYQIDALKEMGVSLAMDDFGTGYSSLSYLWRFGFDRLKVDRSFVSGLERDPIRSRQVIETILMLGERLNMRVTAEGIETEKQARILADLGCDILQGYLFGRPAALPQGEAAPEQNERRVSGS